MSEKDIEAEIEKLIKKHEGLPFNALVGKVIRVLSRGETVIEDDHCVAERGRGRFLHRKLDFSYHH